MNFGSHCDLVADLSKALSIHSFFFFKLLFFVFFFFQASVDHLTEHYIELKEKPFFKDLVTYMSSGPVVAMVSLHQALLREALKIFIV